MLKWLVGSKARERVLAALFKDRPEAVHFRGLVRETGLSPLSLKRVLDDFEAAGIIESEWAGNQRSYKANEKHALYAELSSIVKKTVGLADVLRAALRGVEMAFVYGSIARGDARPDSDVDLFVVGKPNDEVYAGLRKAEEAIGREVNPAFYSVKELREKRGFVERVLQEDKIMVVGNEEEFKRLVEGERNKARRTR